MLEVLTYNYAWIKGLHIISVMAWMAGMLYLPRLYVYHAGAATGSEMSETFKLMERRLLRFIINPAMIAAFVFGILMFVINNTLLQLPWMHIKLTLIFFMTAFHGLLARWRKDFANDRNKHSAKFYRIWNEVPTVLMIAIVLLAVVKPLIG